MAPRANPGLVRRLAPAIAALAGCALASGSPAQDYSALKPDPKSIPFTSLDAIPWKGGGSNQTYALYGSPTEAGPYSILMRWMPGSFSHPHLHEQTRYITVLKGTWWVSSSTHYDPAKTFPMPAGSVVRNEANEVHWDGARDAPVILQISGMGPARSIPVDEQGNRVARAPRAPNQEQ